MDRDKFHLTHDNTSDEESSSSCTTQSHPKRRHNHSEIEKRRRDRMSSLITELSELLMSSGVCGGGGNQRKLDKLTVLRMAVQQVRRLQGSLAVPVASCPRPAYVTKQELNKLVVFLARGSFLMVVGCDHGHLQFLSASVTDMLHYDQSELLGKSLFTILHPKDVATVKEQLSPSNLTSRDPFLDDNTVPGMAESSGGATKLLSTGARRSFFCRIMSKLGGTLLKEELEFDSEQRNHNQDKYCAVQCTGYLKSWGPEELCSISEEDTYGGSCLVAVVRALHEMVPPAATPSRAFTRGGVGLPTRKLQFNSRHDNEGKYLFVDPRVTLVLGFLPQELVGTSLYEHVSGPALGVVAHVHKEALSRRVQLRTPPYAVRCKNGSTVLLQTDLKPFRNPWTKEMECLVAQNTLMTEAPPPPVACAIFDAPQQPQQCLADASGEGTARVAPDAVDVKVQQLIDSHVESHIIGTAIAETTLRRSPDSIELGQLDLPPEFFNSALIVDTDLQVPDKAGAARSATDESGAGAGCGSSGEAADREAGSSQEAGSSGEGGGSTVGGAGEAGGSPGTELDGDSEATMAMIMSLLEADAGLGGPVDFSNLPWPLP